MFLLRSLRAGQLRTEMTEISCTFCNWGPRPVGEQDRALLRLLGMRGSGERKEISEGEDARGFQTGARRCPSRLAQRAMVNDAIVESRMEIG